jgi:hypothetical protein
VSEERSSRDITDPIDIQEAAAIIDRPVRTIQDWCAEENDELLKCRKVGNVWIVSEASARNFVPPKKGRPPKKP